MALPQRGASEIPSCHGALENLDDELDYVIDNVEGTLPGDLTGTFFRNGPGRQRIGATPYGHWFDGDGMISAFTFQGGAAHFRNRYVRTPKYVDETAAQAIRYRGFGTQVPGGLLKNVLRMPANPANTHVMWHGGHLLALNEGGKPWKLDPATLDTIGEFTYGGALRGADVFSAHGKIHPQSGDYINFGAGVSGIGLSGPRPCLNVYRIDAGGRMMRRATVPLQTFPFCHDFALTARYAVFFVGSIVFGNMLNVVLGRTSISDQVRFDPSVPMRAVVCDLDTLAVVREFETDAGAIIHFGNAFEDGNELVIDAMFAGDFQANDTLKNVFDPSGRFGGGTYRRYRLNLGDGSLSYQQVTDVESEFPTFNTALAGSRNEVTYTACSVHNGANSFFNAIQRIDFDGNADLVTLPPGHYGSEPVYAAREGAASEDDGYVLEVVYDAFAHRSQLQVHRAQQLGDIVCTLKLPHHLPHQFHGYFAHEVFA